jgi:hypothetical protein
MVHRVPAAAQNGGSRTCSRGAGAWLPLARLCQSLAEPESYHLGSPTRDQVTIDKPLTSRDGRIRTGGLLLPKQN